jgi:microcompartment protein CcmL/EutN
MNIQQEKVMSGQSLGLIETVGLAAAIEAADAAMKSANVQLVGYELTKGGGMVTVKFEGEVGAINAAVAAGVAAASKVSQVYAHRVIARTAEYIDNIIHSADTVGLLHIEPEAKPTTVSLEIPVVVLEESDSGLSCADIPETPTPEIRIVPAQPAAPAETKPLPTIAESKKASRSGNNKKR